MKNFHTVVLERMRGCAEGFATEPYETGWAGEATFFIRIHELSGEAAVLEARVQLSADGIGWVDEGTAFPPLQATGDYFIRVKHFGGWLRLLNTISGRNVWFKLTEHLVLKE